MFSLLSEVTYLYIEPEDFMGPAITLMFDSGTNRSCVDFTALEDDVVEGTENLTAVLTSDDDDVILLPGEAVINIMDDDGMTVLTIQNVS
jgi:hypothetical protein